MIRLFQMLALFFFPFAATAELLFESDRLVLPELTHYLVEINQVNSWVTLEDGSYWKLEDPRGLLDSLFDRPHPLLVWKRDHRIVLTQNQGWSWNYPLIIKNLDTGDSLKCSFLFHENVPLTRKLETISWDRVQMQGNDWVAYRSNQIRIQGEDWMVFEGDMYGLMTWRPGDPIVFGLNLADKAFFPALLINPRSGTRVRAKKMS